MDQLTDLSVKHLPTCHTLSPALPASLIGLAVEISAVDYGKWILSKEYSSSGFVYSHIYFPRH